MVLVLCIGGDNLIETHNIYSWIIIRFSHVKVQVSRRIVSVHGIEDYKFRFKCKKCETYWGLIMYLEPEVELVSL